MTLLLSNEDVEKALTPQDTIAATEQIYRELAEGHGLTAAAMGWLWLWLGRAEWLKPVARQTGHRPGQSRWNEFRTGFQHDFLHAGGFLVVGAMAAATFNVLVPRTVLDTFAGSPWLSVLFLAALAILLSVCSEADAFVAASLTGFSPTARLTFMVVGPMVDLKLIALQTGTFGRACRPAPSAGPSRSASRPRRSSWRSCAAS